MSLENTSDTNLKPPVYKWDPDFTPDFLLKRVEMVIELDADETQCEAIYSIERQGAHQRPLVLEGYQQVIGLHSIALNERTLKPAEYTLEPESITLWVKEDIFTLKISVTVKPRENLSGEGLYCSSEYLLFQGEQTGMRRFIYCLDNPSQLPFYKVTLIAKTKHYPILIANGIKTAGGTLDPDKHYVTWESERLGYPTIYFGLFAGNFSKKCSSFQYPTGESIDIEIYGEEKSLLKADYAIEALKMGFLWFYENYGLKVEAPVFRHFIIRKFNAGAMEIPCNNSFNNELYECSPETQTDDDYKRVLSVVWHELAHHWFGFEVGIKSMLDMTLKEGDATDCNQSMEIAFFDGDESRIRHARYCLERVFPEMRGPLAGSLIPKEVSSFNNLYKGFRYEGSAKVRASLRVLLGEETFKKGVAYYCKKFKGKAVTALSMVDAFSESSGKNLEQFKHWYTAPGLPVLDVLEDYNSTTQVYTLTISQRIENSSECALYMIPVRLALLDSNGHEMDLNLKGSHDQKSLKEIQVILTKPSHTFEFIEISTKPILSFLRNVEALVDVKCPQSLNDTAWLAQHDPNIINRWKAGYTFFKSQFIGLFENIKSNGIAAVDKRLSQIVHRLLLDERLSCGVKAEMLSFPTEEILSEFVDEFNPEICFQTRQILQTEIARANLPHFENFYNQLSKQNARDFSVLSMGKRSFKNVCLGYLASLKEPKFEALVLNQVKNATQMTDIYHALHLMCQYNHPKKQESLLWFYDQYQSEETVVSKWFRVQAHTGTLKEIQALLEHSAFHWDVPNEVRAVLGAFAARNRYFHDESGSGYQFLCDAVIYLDQTIKNSDVAGGIFYIGFHAIKQFDAGRKKMMRMIFENMLKNPLSPEVYELAEKFLKNC